MPAFIPTVRRSLADWLHALRSDLDSLGQQLRAEIAASVGKAVAGAITDAVHNVLGGKRRAPPARRNWPAEPTRQYWDMRDRRDYDAWSESPDDPWADRYEPDRYEEADEDEPEPTPSNTPPLRSWVAALFAGVRAGMWWLKRQRGRSPLLTTLAVGLVAGLVTLAAGPVVTAAASAVGAVVGLTALSDAARSTVGDLAGTFSP